MHKAIVKSPPAISIHEVAPTKSIEAKTVYLPVCCHDQSCRISEQHIKNIQIRYMDCLVEETYY